MYREVRGGLAWPRTRSVGIIMSGKAARLSMSLILLKGKCSLCLGSSRVVVNQASECRRIFAEKMSDVGSPPMQAYFR